MTIIEDGTGTGRKAKVNSKNQLRVRVTQHTEEHFASQDEEQSYLVSTGQVAARPTLTLLTTEQGNILYLENTGTTNMIISQIGLLADTAGLIFTLYKNRVEGTITQNSTVVPTNLNFGSAKIATAQAEVWDETNGNGIQGLTNGDIMSTGIIGIALFLDTQGSVILPQGKSITMHVHNPTGGTVEISAAMRFYFDDEV